MEQITIDIQLDPMKDGIKVPETDLSRPDAHAVILGTNGKIRQISMKEAETILDQMATCGAGTHLGKSDYIAVYNKDKLFKAEGEEYLVGSVLIFQRAGNVLKAIPDDEIGDLLEVAMAQMDTLKAGEDHYSMSSKIEQKKWCATYSRCINALAEYQRSGSIKGIRQYADAPAERVSLKAKLEVMKAKVAGEDTEKPMPQKVKGKEETL